MIHNVIQRQRLTVCKAAAVASCMMIGATAAMAAPPATVNGTYATVAIGDLPGMMDSAATLAGKVKPGISGEVVRGQLGMLLGDEGLKSIAPGSGMVAVVPTSGKSFVLLETADGKAGAVADLLKQKGLMAEAISDKLIGVGMDEPSLTAAKGEMGKAAAATLDGNDDKFIVATIDTDKLIQDKGPQLEQFLKSLPEKAAASGDSSSTAPAKMLAVMGQVINSVAKRTDVATLKIDISGEGVHFEKTLFPKGGVKLEEPTGPSGEELGKLLPASDNSFARYESYLDTQSMLKALSPMLLEVVNSTEVSAEEKNALTQMFTLVGEGFGDGFAGQIGLEGEKPKGVYVLSILDQEKALQYMEYASSAITTGPLSGFYSSLGIETSSSLTRNVSTVDGHPVHHFSMKMSGEIVEKNPMMSQMEDTKLAFVDDKLVMAIGGASIEEAVKAVKSGSGGASALKSRSDLPPGGDIYIDYNAGAFGQIMAKENAELGEALSGLKDSPILEAGYIDQESVKLMLVIPDELITNAVESFSAMAQKAQQSDSDSSEDSEGTTPTE